MNEAGSDPQAAVRPDAERGSRAALAVVFATILIDFAGFSVLFPVLPLYAEKLGGTPTQIGAMMTVFAAVQLLFLPAWGFVSDRVGRRPVLLASLAGTTLSFLVLARSETIAAILVARAIAGFFAASLATAQAVVTDVTPASQRARGMGIVGAAIGLGMMVGPLLGSFMIRFGPAAPFLAVAVLATLNLTLAWFRLPETRPRELTAPSWRRLRGVFVPAPLRLFSRVHGGRIRLYLYLYFHIYTGFAVLEAMITLYAGRRFGVGIAAMGWFFAWIALCLSLTQGVLLRRLLRVASEAALVQAGLFTLAAGLVGTVLAPSFGWLFAVAPVIALGYGIAMPTFASLYSQACDAEHVGHLLGQGQSMATAGRIVGPLLGGLAMQHAGLSTPFVAAGVFMIAGLALFRAQRATLVAAD